MKDEILTVPQVAELLECSDDKAAELLLEGTLPGVKFGRSWIIPAKAFLDRLNCLAATQASERRLKEPAESPEPSRRRVLPDLGPIHPYGGKSPCRLV